MRMPLILGLIAVCTAAPTGSPLRELESYSVEELDELLAEYSLNTDDMASIATNPGALLFPSVPTTPLDRTETYVPTRQLPIDQKPFSASPTLTTPRRKVLSKRPMTIQEGLRRSMREIVIRRTSKSIWNDYAASGCSSDKGVLQWLTNRIPDWTTQLDFFRTECIEKESPGAVTAVDIPHYIHMAVLSWIHTQIPDLKASDEDNVLSQQVDLVEMISNRALDNANQDTYFIDVLTLMSSKKGHNFNAKASKLIREIEANEDAVLLQKRSIEAELAKKAAEEMAREEEARIEAKLAEEEAEAARHLEQLQKQRRKDLLKEFKQCLTKMHMGTFESLSKAPENAGFLQDATFVDELINHQNGCGSYDPGHNRPIRMKETLADLKSSLE